MSADVKVFRGDAGNLQVRRLWRGSEGKDSKVRDSEDDLQIIQKYSGRKKDEEEKVRKQRGRSTRSIKRRPLRAARKCRGSFSPIRLSGKLSTGYLVNGRLHKAQLSTLYLNRT